MSELASNLGLMTAIMILAAFVLGVIVGRH